MMFFRLIQVKSMAEDVNLMVVVFHIHSKTDFIREIGEQSSVCCFK